MSDHSQTIVGVDVAEKAAGEASRRIAAHLIARGVVLPGLTDCVLAGMGHAPGPRASEVVRGSSKELELLRGLRTNGVKIEVGRTVFDTGGNGLEVRCAACGASFEPGDAYTEAVGAWYEGDDGAAYACDECGVARPLREWDGDWAWAFGFLGVTFWNWPPLRGEFVEEVGALMGGRVRVVRSRG